MSKCVLIFFVTVVALLHYAEVCELLFFFYLFAKNLELMLVNRDKKMTLLKKLLL